MSEKDAKSLGVLDRLVARLRAPDGCPWDREQGFDDIRAYLLEEAHEVAAAIDERNWSALVGELGDLLFQVAFLSRLNEEQGRPGSDAAITSVHDKMVERHPHVFGNEQVADRHEVLAQWERRKLSKRGDGACLLAGLSSSLPSLLAAYRMTQKAAGVGFDWPEPQAVMDKVDEELAEVREALDGDREELREEIGDLLFTVANLARHLEIDPEAALARANLKFRHRFEYIEETLRSAGEPLSGA
ncbi:MAG: nucleoside triphosphate pyrophosphohydrolase, partial [Acidobacteriota bacterium]|nr:nucleoside triphosphate pyrophosphohydrolase [Acidobacteriota bacterium]